MDKKFAFVDVQNTDNTTKQLLGFQIDWKRLCEFLKTEWRCENVFLYIGIDAGDLETAKMAEDLRTVEYIVVRDKTMFAYKIKDKDLNIECPKCHEKFIEHVDMGYKRKSNCDVDLTVDAMELGGSGKEFFIFTGDGDFEFLVRKLNEKGTKVHIVSSSKKIPSGPRYFYSRFSTKLRDLITKNNKMVDFRNINNLRFKIEKR